MLKPPAAFMNEFNLIAKGGVILPTCSQNLLIFSRVVVDVLKILSKIEATRCVK